VVKVIVKKVLLQVLNQKVVKLLRLQLLRLKK
jgi:hypothetical protein